MIATQWFNKFKKYELKVLISSSILLLIFSSFYFIESTRSRAQVLDLAKILSDLKNQDQLKINEQLKIDIKKTHDAYIQIIKPYEKIQDLKAQKQDVKELEKTYAGILQYLSDLNYSSGSALLTQLNSDIDKKYNALATAQTLTPSTQTASVSNTPPGSGYSFQAVKTENGTFNVAIIAADLNSTRVIVDTASDSDCSNNCPVLSLGDYVARSGAYAGINGPFFCPAEYPSCAGKTNSFDTLLMNKNKHYFNSDNNVYSTVPAAIFSAGSARFVSRSLEWGRDTGVDAVIANYRLLIAGNNINFTE